MKVRKSLILTITIGLILTGLSFSANADTIENSLGVGLGLPYGGVGVNYELGLSDYIAPTFGVGYLPDNLGWNLGLRLYYPGRDNQFRGRFTALYGTNTILEKKGVVDSEYDTETGFAGGIGFSWRFSTYWAFDGDLFFANSDVPAGYEEKDNDIFIALGLSYRW